MFQPASNRLSKFFEISSLFIHLAQSGGYQAKAGVLSIEGSSGTKGAFARKGLGWREKRRSKWCAVRESYLVVLEDPGEVRCHPYHFFCRSHLTLVDNSLRFLKSSSSTKTSKSNVQSVSTVRALTFSIPMIPESLDIPNLHPVNLLRVR